jgi:CubicO group peptidase (beta-lactamase class C family)
MDSLLVVRHGRIVLEATYAPFRAGLKHRINSVTKLVIGTLIGIALNEGVLGLKPNKSVAVRIGC